MKTSELSGAALDWAVAKCEGVSDAGFLQFYEGDEEDHEPPEYHYTTDWTLGGAIIERERICLEDAAGMYWTASLVHEDKEYGGVERAEEQGATPLVAAMRCYVASKLGNEVQIPEGI